MSFLSSARRIAAVTQRYLGLVLRSPSGLLDATVTPALQVVLFGAIGVFASRGTSGAAAGVFFHLLVGAILWFVVHQMHMTVVGDFMEEVWGRNILSLMITPLREWEYAIGVALVGLVKVTVSITVVSLAAWALYAFDITTLGLWLLPVTALLLGIGWAIGIFILGLMLRFGQRAEVLAWNVLFLVAPLSGVYYSVDSLPPVMQPLSEAIPTTHVFAAARILASHESMPGRELLLGVVGTFATILCAVAYLVIALRTFRSRGFIIRHM